MSDLPLYSQLSLSALLPVQRRQRSRPLQRLLAPCPRPVAAETLRAGRATSAPSRRATPTSGSHRAVTDTEMRSSRAGAPQTPRESTFSTRAVAAIRPIDI